ncbi:AMP-binding protein [Gordonia rubripertincta]|uniref:AMP-binding protein n=1 Tax=Gordonia rubripertincta TaxID=36822 RepID=A0ABT4MNL7_GORRU|nr:AMP-binding protein [Gordonia rubripertincta]MCZ4548592.1 AMP-binding protein [Gordonia rubripertincta]
MPDTVPWVSLPRMLRDQARHHSRSIAVSDAGVTISYAELHEQAKRFAQSLQLRGIEPGDRVGVWAPNCWQWVVAAFGIWDCGAVIVPLSTRAKGIETADVLRRTGCRALVMVDDFLGHSYSQMLDTEADHDSADRPFAAIPDLHTVICIAGPMDRPGGHTWNEFLALASQVSDEESESVALAVTSDDIFEILMTSGTTGEPKGVVLGGGQILQAYWHWSNICGLTAGDRMPVVSPFAHGFGINAGIIACVMRGATIVPIAVFDPDSTVDLIEREKLTVLAGPPNLFSRILSHPELPHRDTSTLRWAVIGAASVPEELVLSLRDRLGFERVTNAYGLIEGSVVTMTRAEDPVHVVAGTAGRPVDGMEIRLVNADGASVSPGDRGEVQIRGYGVMQRYWDAEQLTRDAFTKDGWLRTGDVGVLDDLGNLRLVGRTKEMFIVGGFNAYPAEIENLLMHNHSLSQAAVIGVPDDRLGEVPLAFVTVEDNAATESDITRWARQNLSNYKVPRRVVIIDAMPVTANGKIDKSRLRTMATNIQSPTRSSDRSPSQDTSGGLR